MVAGERPQQDASAEPVAPRQEAAKRRAPAPMRSHLRVGVLPFARDPCVPQDENLALSHRARRSPRRSRAFAGSTCRADGLMRGARRDLRQRRRVAPQRARLRGRRVRSRADGSKYHISVRLLDLTHYATPVWSNRSSCRPTSSTARRASHRAHRRADRSGHPVHRRPAEAQRGRRRDRLLMRAHPAALHHGAREIRGGRPLDRAGARDGARQRDGARLGAPTGTCSMSGQGWARTMSATAIGTIAANYASRAIQIDPDNAEALGDLRAHLGVPAQGLRAWRCTTSISALRLNRNLPFIWALSALTYCYIGEPDTALQRMRALPRARAVRMPYFCLFENPVSIAYLMKRRIRGSRRDRPPRGREHSRHSATATSR